MAPIRHVAAGGGVEFEVDPATGHTAWRVAGRWAAVGRARAVAGDGAVDQILRTTVAMLRVQALDIPEDRERLRLLAGRIWRERMGDRTERESGQPRLF